MAEHPGPPHGISSLGIHISISSLMNESTENPTYPLTYAALRSFLLCRFTPEGFLHNLILGSVDIMILILISP